ncbi:MAG: hypothetical protein JW940_37740 [Polyangiaceae bacterium]|nr:hypothetical protein [Polyangiaceae bacterium]
MKHETPDELEARLFDAGRDELPSEARLGRIRAGVHRAMAAEWREPTRRRHGARTRFGVALLAAVALAAVAAVCVGFRWRERLRITADGATVPTDVPAHNPPAPAPLPKEDHGLPAPPSRKPMKPAPAQTTLADELESLQRVRALLGREDARQALQELARYDRVLKGRQMRAEAEMLRIEATAQQGQREAARELAERFVTEHPNHPLADRARVFISNMDGGATEDGGTQGQRE